MQTPSIPLTLFGLISLGLAGCAGTKDTVLPQDGPSMKTIYQQHMEGLAAQAPRVIASQALGTRPLATEAADLPGYSREAARQIETVFPRLPNPILVMYVYPHLAGEDRVPVPGYVTTFPLYERTEYALPGEVPSSTE